jgi:hypothetical protein
MRNAYKTFAAMLVGKNFYLKDHGADEGIILKSILKN